MISVTFVAVVFVQWRKSEAIYEDEVVILRKQLIWITLSIWMNISGKKWIVYQAKKLCIRSLFILIQIEIDQIVCAWPNIPVTYDWTTLFEIFIDNRGHHWKGITIYNASEVYFSLINRNVCFNCNILNILLNCNIFAYRNFPCLPVPAFSEQPSLTLVLYYLKVLPHYM